MDVLIQAGEKLEGKINIPHSKSYGQRALAASLLVFRSKISNLGKSADELVALQVIRACGSKLTSLENGAVEIETRFDFNKDIKLDCGESGLAARLFACLFMLNQRETYTLEIKKKALKYNFEELQLIQEAKKEAGFSFN